MHIINTSKYFVLQDELKKLDLEEKISKYNTILIKPNLVHLRTPESGTITHPECIREILKYLCSFYNGNILLGDASSYHEQDSEKIFNLAGINELQREFPNISVINFKKYPHEKLNYSGEFLKEISLPQGIEQWGIINVPKLKEHWLVNLSVAVKNMVGLLENPRVIHDYPIHRKNKEIHERIADLYLAIEPNIIFTIVDGITGMRNGQVDGETIYPNKLVIGNNCVEIDRWAQNYFRLPKRIPSYLDIIEQMKQNVGPDGRFS